LRFLAEDCGLPGSITRPNLVAGVRYALALLDVGEKLSDVRWLWPTGMVPVKAPMGIVVSDQPSGSSLSNLFQDDRGALEAVALAYDDPARDSVRIIEWQCKGVFVAAPGTRFVVEVIHVRVLFGAAPEGC